MSIRKVLVTGASSGIGKEIVLSLLEEGEEVFGISRRISSPNHPRLHLHSIDLTKLTNLTPSTLAPFATVDTIICSAGKGVFGHLEQIANKDILSTFTLNTLSPIYLIKALLPSLKKKKRADIIFIGSEAALSGKRAGSIYCASKFALRGFAQSLREECASSSVRVSIIQPGMVRTPFYDTLFFSPGEESSHALLPSEIAKAVTLILSSRAETIFEEIIVTPKKHVVRKKGSANTKSEEKISSLEETNLSTEYS